MSNIAIYYASKKIGSVEYDDKTVTIDVPEDKKYSVLTELLKSTLPAGEDAEGVVKPGSLEHALLALKEASFEDSYTYKINDDAVATNDLDDKEENKGNPNHDPKSGQFSTGSTLAKVSSLVNQATLYQSADSFAISADVSKVPKDITVLYKGFGGDLDFGGSTGADYMAKLSDSASVMPQGTRSFTTNKFTAREYGSVRLFAVPTKKVMPREEYSKLLGDSIGQDISDYPSAYRGFWRRGDKFPEIIPTVRKKYDGFTDTNGEVVMVNLSKVVDVYAEAKGESSPLNSLDDRVENKGGGNPNHDPHSGQFTTGTGSPGRISDPVLKGMVKSAKANGGMTTNLAGNSPTEGIAFAPRKDTETIISGKNFDEKSLNSFVDKHFDTLKKEGMHVGGWYNNDDGNWYLDISKVGPYNKSVIAEAQKAEQLAVFDLKTFNEIKTGDIVNGKYRKSADAETIFAQAFGGGEQGGVQNSSQESNGSSDSEDGLALNRGGNPNHDKLGKFATGSGVHLSGNTLTLSGGDTSTSLTLNNRERALLENDGVSVKMVSESEDPSVRGVYGDYDPPSKTIRMNSDHMDKDFEATFYHEMGHAIDGVDKGKIPGVDTYPRNMFKNLRSKSHPLYGERKSIIQKRLGDDMKKKYTLSDKEIATIDDKKWNDIFKGSAFVAVHKEDGGFARPYYLKSKMKYLQEASEVFGDGYSQYRTNPTEFKKYAPQTSSVFEELTR